MDAAFDSSFLMGSVGFTQLASNLLNTAVIGFENALLKKRTRKGESSGATCFKHHPSCPHVQ